MSVKTIQGNLVSKDLKFGIVAGRFNEFIGSKLVGGAIDGLTRHGADEQQIDLVWVPGAFEIPLAAQKMAKSQKYNAIICVGAVIRGSTPHFDYVASEMTKGIAQVSLQTGIPVVYGVLTTENIEQAIERAGTKVGNKGFDAALTAIEMCNLLSQL
jgi:6,7-dimethyl-8-ribityllumazine synthase